MTVQQLENVEHYSEQDWFRQLFTEIQADGKIVSPRGRKVLEVQDFRYYNMPWQRFHLHPVRNLSMPYIRWEWLWYLHGNRYDTSAVQRAALWKACVQEDGGINSNYGQYLFGVNPGEIDPNQLSPILSRYPTKLQPYYSSQFYALLDTLCTDPDTRRASMVIAQPWHFTAKPHGDYPCTYSVGFRIREIPDLDGQRELRMTVHMRSQDAVHGLGNDIPTFAFLHELVLNLIRPHLDFDIQLGPSCHMIDSLHVYERHWSQIESYVSDHRWLTPDEVDLPPPMDYQSSRWLPSISNLSDLDISRLCNVPFIEWLVRDPKGGRPKC